MNPSTELQSDLSAIILAVVFAIVGLYHIQLYARRRKQKDYLWFGLTALGFAANTYLLSGWALDGIPDSGLRQRLTEVSGHFSALCAIQFLWPFLGRPIGPWLRGYQLSHLGLGLFVAFWPSLALIQASRAVRWIWLAPL